LNDCAVGGGVRAKLFEFPADAGLCAFGKRISRVSEWLLPGRRGDAEEEFARPGTAASDLLLANNREIEFNKEKDEEERRGLEDIMYLLMKNREKEQYLRVKSDIFYKPSILADLKQK
jgi:hypothetical protein